MNLRFGVFLDPLFLSTSYPLFKEQVLEAERLGYDSIWVSDHLMTGKKPIFECFTTLSSFAAITKTIRLGSLVACNSYRNPSILAKTAATVDIVSNGRLEFGIGAGWDEEEYRAYGIPFLEASARIAQLREGVEIIRRMWTEERSSYSGRYFSITGAYCEPKPVQKPHPKITIGGGGEKLILRVVAEYADRWNWGGSVEEFAQRLKVLEARCSQVGRNCDAIEKSLYARVKISKGRRELRSYLEKLYSSGQLYFRTPVSFEEWFESLRTRNVVGTRDECLARIREYADLGVTCFMLNFLDLPSAYDMRVFAEEIMGKV
jgi:F420-dependent oxidoreductase-like protein